MSPPAWDEASEEAERKHVDPMHERVLTAPVSMVIPRWRFVVLPDS